jgi:hypothetical protein
MQYSAFDSQKNYTLARVENADGHRVYEARIAHKRGALKEFWAVCEPDSPVAVETRLPLLTPALSTAVLEPCFGKGHIQGSYKGGRCPSCGPLGSRAPGSHRLRNNVR